MNRTINIILIIVALFATAFETHRLNKYYTKEFRSCLIKDKMIKYYNATENSRHVSLRTKSVFVCKCLDYILEVPVSYSHYYNYHIGDTVHFNLSIVDMNHYIPNNENYQFLLYFTSMCVLIVVFLYRNVSISY